MDDQVPGRAGGVTPARGEPVNTRNWLAQNAPMLLLVGAAFAAFCYFHRDDLLDELWSWGKAAFGLGFVVFIHELGHFALAKWCDVHVETFSIGFGPALPGCSFRRGETLYKIALFPLGGYVKMVGEGGDNEEGEDDPRSFKNKSVGQRMAIISAGVVMNVLLGCICFIFAYKSGVEQIAAVVGSVDVNSPAWKKGIPAGSEMLEIDGVKDPYFQDLKFAVMLSNEGKKIHLVTRQPDGPTRDVMIEPRREKTDPSPVIGVAPVTELKLMPHELAKDRDSAVLVDSPAGAARALGLKPGEVVIGSTVMDGQPNDIKPIASKAGHTDFAELTRRMSLLAGKPMTVSIKGAGEAVARTLAPDGFHFEDRIVGTTDANQSNQPYDPYRLAPLPVDPRDPSGKNLDYFEFTRRLKSLAGKPIVLLVTRYEAAPRDEPVPILMPPAFHYSLPGVSLEMGPVVGVRDNSAAEKAGVKPNDILKEVELVDRKTGEQARFVFHSGKNETGQDVKVVGDPLRLAHALRQWCQDRPSVGVVLTVGRVNEETHKAFDPTRLAQVDWDSSWRFDEEVSLGPPSPAAVPELGLAYQVKTTIARVEPGSAGEAAGLRKDDVILEVNVRKPALKATEPSFGKDPFKLWTEQKVEGDADKRRAEAWWPYVPAYINHRADYKDVELLVKRAGSDDQRIQLSFQPDTTWPSADPGLDLLITQSRLQRAANMGEAIRMGGHRTFQSIVQVYQGLKSMITGRLPFMANASGPIGIAAVAHTLAGRDMVMFVLFLGLISVNLAVVNFLPIPVLDGGHMVFLLYEKLRGKPASERVREATTYAGVAIILTLMLVVVFVDVKKLLSW